MRLAGSVGLRELADAWLSVPMDKGANAGLKVSSLVAGMLAGADSIDDMALLARACTAESAPVILAQRPRKCAANSARGAHRLITDACSTLKRTGNTGRCSCVPIPPSTGTPASPQPRPRGPRPRSRCGWIRR